VLSTLKNAYVEFERRVGEMASPRGSKSALVEAAIMAKDGSFTLTALERDCPSVSRDLIRRVLGELRKKGTVESIGRGPGAAWRKKR
jgi:DNA-binding IscR family transcriptional regulator